MIRLKTHIIFVILIALLIGNPLCGQDYVKDMEKISARFKEDDLTYRIRYTFYTSDSLKKIADSVNIVCSTSGEGYYCNVSSSGKRFEYYKNYKYYFIISHPESIIVVKKSSEAKQQAWDMGKVDSLIHVKGVSVSYKNVGKAEGEYSITMTSKSWNRIRLVFSKSDYRLEKIYMCSDAKSTIGGVECNKPVIIMTYWGYSEKKIDKSIFSESKYFIDLKNELVLTSAYKKYRLLDYVYKMQGRS